MKFCWHWGVTLSLLLAVVSPSPVFAVPMTKEQLFQLATLAAGDRQFDRAVELLQKVIELDPKFAPAYNTLGLVNEMSKAGDVREQIRYFKLAVDLAPDYLDAWNNLGRSYYSAGMFIEAEKAFLRSLTIKPLQADIELALGWDYLLGQSRADEAVTYFDRAMARLGSGQSAGVKDSSMTYYGLGLAYLMKGDRYKVLDAVTQLRRHNREEQAARLEAMVRDNVRLTSTPGQPLVTGQAGEMSVFDKELEGLKSQGFKSGGDGIKVRLKGPLL
jgi:tetratricopeptide (TPR) repeat protein